MPSGVPDLSFSPLPLMDEDRDVIFAVKEKVMVYPGTDKKYMIIASQEDFNLMEDPWELLIKDRYGRVRYARPKSECFWDSDGNYYFTLEDLRQGAYFAFFRGAYEDDDYDKQKRVFTDVQKLLEVGKVPDCPSRHTCRRHVISYVEVTTVSVDGEDYLADKDGKYIYTSDGKRICFKNDKSKEIEDMGKVRLETLSGKEFKQLIEGRTPDGTINTVQEMFDAARGISDDETIQEDVDKQIDEQLDEQAATDDDIDEMFD